jgi:hypothetical protein
MFRLVRARSGSSCSSTTHVGLQGEANLDTIEEVTGNIDLAVEASTDVPAEPGAAAAIVGEVTVEAVAEDLNENLETLTSSHSNRRSPKSNSISQRWTERPLDQDVALAAEGAGSALGAPVQDDVISDLVADASILGGDALVNDAGGGDGLPEPDGIAAEGLCMLLDPQLDHGLGSASSGERSAQPQAAMAPRRVHRPDGGSRWSHLQGSIGAHDSTETLPK